MCSPTHTTRKDNIHIYLKQKSTRHFNQAPSLIQY
nr:MAG TPA: hypothetical protein [Caudoviricetes sp.]